jgi:hypothetical protein
MDNVARTTLNSFNYLFLQYAVYEPSLYGNHIIEVELERFLEALAQEADDMFHSTSVIANDVIQELVEGDYLHKYTPYQLKQQIKDAIASILGYEDPLLYQFYSACVDAVASQISLFSSSSSQQAIGL